MSQLNTGHCAARHVACWYRCSNYDTPFITVQHCLQSALCECVRGFLVQ